MYRVAMCPEVNLMSIISPHHPGWIDPIAGHSEDVITSQSNKAESILGGRPLQGIITVSSGHVRNMPTLRGDLHRALVLLLL